LPYLPPMEKHILSKSTFIRGTQCLKSLYLNKKRPFLRNRLSDSQRAVFKRGTDVGLLAQQLFPGGVDLKPRSPALYLKKVAETLSVIREQRSKILYEATFQYDRLLVLLDILVNDASGWNAYEVKSSLQISETFLLDAAFQYYVITHAGVALNDFFLVYLNKDYTLHGGLNLEELFVKKSVLKEVKERQPFIENQIEKEKQALKATSSPKIPIGPQCHSPYPCDFLGHCWKKVPANSILYLDAFDADERFEKYYSHADNTENLPDTGLTPLQKIQLTSARAQSSVADDDRLNSFLDKFLQNPVFVAFLWVKPAIPFLQGSRPYQPLPVAAISGKKQADFSQVTFFIEEENPLDSFIAFSRKLLEMNSTIIVYDKSEILTLLQATGDETLLTTALSHIADFKTLFSEGILFHYLLHGDYSAQQAAKVFLKQSQPLLDPSLLQMEWQQKLFHHDVSFSLTKTETEKYLHRQMLFHLQFANYLKNKR
jgi:hypothetical protein